MIDLVQLAPTGSVMGLLAWAFPAAGLVGAALAARRRGRLVAGLLLVALASLLAAWAAGRTTAVSPRQALPLVGAAVAFALLTGIGVESIAVVLRGRSFGIAHVLVALTSGFLIAGMGVAVGFTARGRYDGLRVTGGLAPAFLSADEAQTGAFRVLWIGASPPVRGRASAILVELTEPQGQTMLSYAVRRGGPGDAYLVRASAALLSGRTDLGGRLLAPLGVRQIIVRPGSPPAVSLALSRQADLRFRETFGGARVFDNTAWLPVAAPLASKDWIAAAGRADPFSSLAAVDAGKPARGLAHVRSATFEGLPDAHATLLTLAEPFDARWRLHTRTGTIQPRLAFGYATAFALPAGAGPVRIEWAGQHSTRALLLVQLGLWTLLGVWWSRRAALERGER
jgi:hypothetical protein